MMRSRGVDRGRDLGADGDRYASCCGFAAMRIRFDRGTLVLEAERDGEAPEAIAGVAWDDELRAWRLPAERYAAVTAALAEAGVAVSDELRSRRTEMTWALPALRWYQDAALGSWLVADGGGKDTGGAGGDRAARSGDPVSGADARAARSVGAGAGGVRFASDRPAGRWRACGGAGHGVDVCERDRVAAADRRPLRAGDRG